VELGIINIDDYAQNLQSRGYKSHNVVSHNIDPHNMKDWTRQYITESINKSHGGYLIIYSYTELYDEITHDWLRIYYTKFHKTLIRAEMLTFNIKTDIDIISDYNFYCDASVMRYISLSNFGPSHQHLANLPTYIIELTYIYHNTDEYIMPLSDFDYPPPYLQKWFTNYIMAYNHNRTIHTLSINILYIDNMNYKLNSIIIARDNDIMYTLQI
jgi:hypothetical protein